MRKVLISLLLASAAATPALAARPDQSDRQQAREERQQAREEARSERSSNQSQSNASQNNNRPERAERVAQPRPQNFQAPQQQQRVQFNGGGNAGNAEAYRAQRDARSQALQAGRDVRVEQRQDRIQNLRNARELRQSNRARPPVISRVPRPGTQPPPPVVSRPVAQPNWSTSWRNNSRYDWQNHRRHHRSLFHFGFYYDPFGWGYNPFQIGWRMWPSYYSSRFWISDPWQYRLPYAPPGTHWVRYYNDAVLVDTWSGQVVDVIYNFFW